LLESYIILTLSDSESDDVEETTPKPKKKAFKVPKNKESQSEDESESLSDLLANFRTLEAFKKAMERRAQLLAQVESNSELDDFQIQNTLEEAPAKRSQHQLDSDSESSDLEKFQTPKVLRKASAKRPQQLDSEESEDAGKANVAQTHKGEIALNSGNFC
jgi:multidrug resistance efflux pump